LKNYKLTLQYDGTDYSGWQFQLNNKTVQQTITDAIKILLKEEVNLIAAGRTDAGVHALGQVANFRTESDINPNKFIYSINAILPTDIAIKRMEEVDIDFHSRFNAVKRSYIYLISKWRSPFYDKYSFRYSGNINIYKLNELSGIFLDQKDYTSFCRKNDENENKNCIIYNARWKETKDIIIFLIEANRFLHGMVRTIVGTLLRSAKENYDVNYIQNIFDMKDRKSAGEAVVAKGLFLYKVKYP
jgi:tRNA pseudouridine38-40 synthase